jgi:hypothetical protein
MKLSSDQRRGLYVLAAAAHGLGCCSALPLGSVTDAGYECPNLPERFLTLYVRHLAHTPESRVETSKAEEYRTKARECEERAKQTRDPFIKQQLLEIAEKWRTMAAHHEKYAR